MILKVKLVASSQCCQKTGRQWNRGNRLRSRTLDSRSSKVLCTLPGKGEDSRKHEQRPDEQLLRMWRSSWFLDITRHEMSERDHSKKKERESKDNNRVRRWTALSWFWSSKTRKHEKECEGKYKKSDDDGDHDTFSVLAVGDLKENENKERWGDHCLFLTTKGSNRTS